MFTGVIIFATAVLAASAQDHHSHHGTSSHSIVHHDKSHNNHEQESSYHSPALIYSDGSSYYRPIFHVAPITRATPITHLAPIAHTYHRSPIHKTHVIHVPVAHHYSPIFTHHTHVHPVAPIIQHATPYNAVPAITLQHVPAQYNQQYTSEHQDYLSQPKYEYEYSVQDSHTSDIKSQHEAGDGDEVNGAYSPREADGSVRTVNYNTHRQSGFHADVHHSQPSSHTQSSSHYYRQ